jgi:hypothetical protein
MPHALRCIADSVKGFRIVCGHKDNLRRLIRS